MKTLTLILTLLFVVNTAQAQQQKPRSNQSKHSPTTSVQGGGDAGGGNANRYELTPLTYEELKIGVTNASKYLRTLIQAQEILYYSSLNNPQTPYSYRAIPGRFYAKFFLDKKRTVYDVLDQIEIKIQDASCWEVEGNGKRVEVDASMSENQMCLSLNRLWKKLTKENLYSETMGVMMHELAHAFGAKHIKNPKKEYDPLILFQNSIAFNVPKYPVKVFMDHPGKFVNDMARLFHLIDSAIDSTATKNTVQSQIYLELLKESLSDFVNAVSEEVSGESLGVSCLKRQQLMDLRDASTEVYMASTTYSTRSDQGMWEVIFEDVKGVKVGDSFTPSFKNPYAYYHAAMAPDLPIQPMIYVGYQDQASLRASLTKIRETLVKTQQQFEKWKPENLGLVRYSWSQK